jgi:hypothetical protein
VASSNSSDTQNPVFWERLRGLFTREQEQHDGENRRRFVASIVCLLISCFLWFTFTLKDTHIIPLTIATAVRNGGSDQALTSLPPKQVRAEIEGEGTVLLRYSFQNPQITIGAESERVRVADLVEEQLPRGARLVSASPAMLNIDREPRLRRTVPVRLRGSVETPSTHDFVNPVRLVPDSIDISGARSLVQSIEGWPTVPVNVPNLRDSLQRSVPLADTLDGLVARSNQSVVLRARAAQFTEGIRSVDVRVTGGPSDAVTLDPSSIRVRYRALVDDYQAAQETDEFYGTVSYEQVRTDTSGQVKPRIHTPPNLTIRDVEMTYPKALRYYNIVAEE